MKSYTCDIQPGIWLICHWLVEHSLILVISGCPNGKVPIRTMSQWESSYQDNFPPGQLDTRATPHQDISPPRQLPNRITPSWDNSPPGQVTTRITLHQDVSPLGQHSTRKTTWQDKAKISFNFRCLNPLCPGARMITLFSTLQKWEWVPFR